MEDMERLTNVRIVVTGGAGFIGSHLVGRLMQLKARVWILDNDYSKFSCRTYDRAIQKANKIVIDIRNRNSVAKILNTIRPDFVYHLAAEALVTDSFQNPYRTFQTNIMGTINILEALRSSKYIKGIIIASSDKAYGKTKTAYTEDSPLKGDHPYDVSKSSADLISQAYYATYHMPIVITRFGNVYGEGDFHFDRLIPGMFKAIHDKKTFEIRSNGQFVRDYIYVKDVAEGYSLLMKKIDKTIGQAYNFSSNDTHSVLQLLAVAEKALGVKIPYKILNTAGNEIPYQHLDWTKIKKIGWKPLHNLKNSLKEVYAWYKQVL